MIAMVVMAVAAAAMSAMGSIQAGQQASAIGSYNNAVEDQRAQIAKEQAGAQAAMDESNNRRKLGEAAAAYGAAGVDMTGTPLAVMSDQATQGELTRRLDLYRGNLTATSDIQQGQLDEAQGNAQKTASYFTAGSTLLSAAGKAASSFYGGGAGTALDLSSHESGH